VTRFFGQNARFLLEANHSTILAGVTQFWNKIAVLYCVRDLSWHDSNNRDTVSTVFGHCLSIHCSFFEESFKRKKLEKSKEAPLWLRVFGEGSLGLKNNYKHLGQVKIIECLVHWWDW